MTHNDFVKHIGRLAAGFGEASLSMDRMEAMFTRFGRYDEEVFATAIDELLCGPRWPSLQAFDQIVARCDSERIERESEHRRGEPAGPIADVFAGRFEEGARVPRGARVRELVAEWREACEKYELRIPIAQYRYWAPDQEKRFQHCVIEDGYAVIR